MLRFGLTPQEVRGEDHVQAVTFGRTGEDSADIEAIDAGLVLRATGHRSTAVVGVPFAASVGRFANDGGRVIDPDSGAPVARTYTTGWAKRGSAGVIGTNRSDAVETAAALLDDYYEGRLPEPAGNAESFDALLADRLVVVIDLEGWKRLDSHEKTEGKAAGRPRVKVSDLARQIEIGTES